MPGVNGTLGLIAVAMIATVCATLLAYEFIFEPQWYTEYCPASMTIGDALHLAG